MVDILWSKSQSVSAEMASSISSHNGGMGKWILCFAIVLVIVSVPTVMPSDTDADANSWEEGGINYEVTSSTEPMTVMVISKNPKYSSVVVIPESVKHNDGTSEKTYSVTSIGEYAFYDCMSLTSVTIPNSVTYIGNYAFGRCVSLASVTIPNSVKTIGEGTFYNCISFTSVTIPNSVTYIGNYAFCECERLTSVTISNSVNTIGEETFYNCTSLTSVTIPNSVTSIGVRAFSFCISLTSVTIPNSVTSIGGMAFSLCRLMSDVYVNATKPPTLGNNVFRDCSENIRIYVPYTNLEDYKRAEAWGNKVPTGSLTSNMIDIPDVIPGLVYNGTSQKGMIESSDNLYTLSGNTAINAGDHTVTVSLRKGSNFVWSDVTTADKEFQWSIAKKDVSVLITAQSKTYDGTMNVILEYDIIGMVPGDDLSFSAIGTFSDKNAGAGKTVTITGQALVGADKDNYNLIETQDTVTADITKRDVTISGLTAKDKEYDGTTDVTIQGTATLSWKYDGDDVTITDGTAAFSTKNVSDSVPVIFEGYALSGKDSGNYNLTEQPTTVSATISKKDVSVIGAITAQGKIYDGTMDSTLVYDGVTIKGMIPGDDLSLSAIGTFSDKNVGAGKTVTITGHALEGADKDNYNLTGLLQDFANADIVPRQVTISGITALNKIYDKNDDATLVYDGVIIAGIVPGDTLSVTAKGTFENPRVGSDKIVNIFDIELEGPSASNYILAPTGQQSSTTADIIRGTEGISMDGTTYVAIGALIAVVTLLGCIIYNYKKD